MRVTRKGDWEASQDYQAGASTEKCQAWGMDLPFQTRAPSLFACTPLLVTFFNIPLIYVYSFIYENRHLYYIHLEYKYPKIYSVRYTQKVESLQK